MTLKVSLEIAKKVTICSPAYEQIVKYYTDNNIESATVAEMIAHWKAMGRRDWALWLYAHVPEFERLVQQESTEAEKQAFLEDENYLSYTETKYRVNSNVYLTLEEANVARQNELDALKPQTEPLIICSLEVIHENGDTSWQNIDLDDFVPPLDKPYVIKVFNPTSGVYDTCDSLQQALEKRNENMIYVADHQFGTAIIHAFKQHPDYPNQIQDIENPNNITNI